MAEPPSHCRKCARVIPAGGPCPCAAASPRADAFIDLKSFKPVFGIDLGTTYCKVSYRKPNGQWVMFDAESDKYSIESVVCFDESTLADSKVVSFVGQKALAKRGKVGFVTL